MNIAEFTILGRVGKIKPFDGKTNVTICANYSFRNRNGERDSAAHWSEVTIFAEATRDYRLHRQIRQGGRFGHRAGPDQAVELHPQRRDGLRRRPAGRRVLDPRPEGGPRRDAAGRSRGAEGQEQSPSQVTAPVPSRQCGGSGPKASGAAGRQGSVACDEWSRPRSRPLARRRALRPPALRAETGGCGASADRLAPSSLSPRGVEKIIARSDRAPRRRAARKAR